MILEGAQQVILKAIHDLQGDSANTVSDAEIAQMTKIALPDVRDCLLTLEDSELISGIRTPAGLTPSSRRRGDWP